MSLHLETEYVNSEYIDEDCFNEGTLISTATEHGVIQEETPHSISISSVPLSTFVPCPNRYLSDDSENTQSNPTQKVQEHQIHTISSSDEEFLIERNTVEQQIVHMFSEEGSDFEGFEDFTIQKNRAFIYESAYKDLNIYSNYLNRYTHTNFNQYHTESEGNVGAVELDDDEYGDIGIGYPEKIVYKSAKGIIANSSRCEPLLTKKGGKCATEKSYTGNSLKKLNTPADQIVEVNSDSTTISLKQKRQQINNKLQLNLCQQQMHKSNNNPNKCSTESTSEFPVSSPSNPQPATCGKYPARPPLLKNTLPADSFERQLAMITACNPQMTLAEKIETWNCEEETSDLEDVKIFDEQFIRLDTQRKLEMKKRGKNGRIKNSEFKNYDFLTFRQIIINNIKEQKHQKYNSSGQGGSGGGLTSGNKCVETSGSESSKSVVHIDERPSTSAVAQQQLQQRRTKLPLYFEAGEPKKRVIKDIPKTNQNSTTPPQTSSSDNERDCFQSSNNNAGQRQTYIYNTLGGGSSSEEYISKESRSDVRLKANNKCVHIKQKNIRKMSPVQPQAEDTPMKSNEKKKSSKNSRVITDEEIQSFFRPHRYIRERDKCIQPTAIEVEKQSTSIIQMRLDFANENQNETLLEKKRELFKTPIVPQKYLPNSIIAKEYNLENDSSTTKNEKQKNFEAISLLKHDINMEPYEEKSESKSPIADMDGVYHQQHEFCNYLGLTGMSTATAMANAVAELAQCNLARRSMRVLRQQQQERRDKSAKEERLVKAIKLKQLKKIRKRDKESCDMRGLENEETSVFKSEEGSNSQTSEPVPSFKQPKKKISNSSTTKSPQKFRISNKIFKRHQNQKTVEDKEVEKLLSESSKNISKASPEEKRTDVQENVDQMGNKVDKTENTVNKISLVENEKILKSPILSDSKAIVEKENIMNYNTPIPAISESSAEEENVRGLKSHILLTGKSHLQNTHKGLLQNLESTTVNSRPDSVSDRIDIKCDSPNLKRKYLNINEISNKHLNVDKIQSSNCGTNLILSTPSNIQQKLQMALEESRKSKPSIFIVQSLEIKKEYVSNSYLENVSLSQNVESPSLQHEMYEYQKPNIVAKESSVSSAVNCNNKVDKRKVFKKLKSKKYPVSKRQLRKRKIIVIKTSKPKHKSFDRLNAIKRELRSSPRINENLETNPLVKKNEKFKQNTKIVRTVPCNFAKSFRTVHTETKDLEIYLRKNTSEAKTMLIDKASSLLERSKRMTLRDRVNMANKKSKHNSKKRTKVTLYGTAKQISKPRLTTANEKNKIQTSPKIQKSPPAELKTEKPNLSSTLNLLDNETVVVSSTTNTYDDKPSYEQLTPQYHNTLKTLINATSRDIISAPINTKDQQTQCSLNFAVHYLNTQTLPLQSMRNPLKSEHGAVLYIYNELEILIVIQENLVSFWKCSKLINMLIMPRKSASHQAVQHSETTLLRQNIVENCNNFLGNPALSPTLIEPNDFHEWIQLGELRRLNRDFEISVPYANRICLHNSTPIYLEMRAQQLPKNQRECNLISMYINIYYYHDEDMIAKCNSIPLDSIQTNIRSINYTTLKDSRYFIITWPQENILGKTRSGLCKYSLTPQLDTLASIREFKSVCHTICYLECMSDDKLIGFGETQVTIWDYRSGDVLMNFDFEMPIGKNLGSIYFPSQDIEQNNVLILHQFHDLQKNNQSQLLTIACTVTHNQPSYKLLQELNLSTSAFKVVKSVIKTVDHLVVTGQNDDELWISVANPRLMTVIPNIENSKRFYNRERQYLIEVTEKTLNVKSIPNHLLQLAAGVVQN